MTQMWCPMTDSNCQPPDYKSGALPVELMGLTMWQGPGGHCAAERAENSAFFARGQPVNFIEINYTFEPAETAEIWGGIRLFYKP